MKNKNFKSLIILSTIFISACATSPDRYIPEPYREEVSYDSTSLPSRVPAAWDCFRTIANFFSPEHEKPKPNIFASIHPRPKAGIKYITEAMATTSTRYPKGFEGIKNAHIQYGFESEYLHEETEPLLKNFMPDSSVYSGSKDMWMGLTHEERLAFIDGNSKKIFPYREKGKLLKISDDPELNAALPDSFVYDAGHFEIVLDPMDTAEELVGRIKTINKKFGIGSMQVTISNPLNKELLKQDKAYREELKSEIVGYYNFMNDFDTLSKLGAGYERYLKDPTAQTAKSFNHPWLGPMTKLKHDKLEKLVDGIVEQKEFTEQELKEMSYLVVSHKFIAGLSFRPDVAYKKGRIASEVRDCHQNIKCIENRIIRETYFLMKGKEAFAPFRSGKAFDSLESFDSKTPTVAQNMLKNIFPSYSTFTQKELELYRNFSFPYRDWSNHVDLLGAPELKNRIIDAQNVYSERLKKIAMDYETNVITKEDAQSKVMGALGEFSKTSGLVDAMNAKYLELVDPTEIKNFDKLKFTIWLNNLLHLHLAEA